MKKRVLVIDDDKLYLDFQTQFVATNYPALELVTCDDPIRGLAHITPELDMLLLDLEMPGMDGAKLLDYAKQKGVAKARIIILSGRAADYLHKLFPMGECLAVLNKHEARQKAVLDMIFQALQRKAD